jgi:LacI family fructose operon transcriptional repressor
VTPPAKPPAKPSTIYDLAERAGTSASTVSAILNGSWQQRRISADTAARVQQLAGELGFAVNRQASGLRRQRSGLIGMMIPTHEDRFFGTMSQAFEREARARGLCPVVVSTLRDAALEVETVRTLITWQVEHLVVTGATQPDAISEECRQAGVRHVNVDLPGRRAPSITSDNRWGAAELTRALQAGPPAATPGARDAVWFLGGIRGEYATEQRILGFLEAEGDADGRADGVPAAAVPRGRAATARAATAAAVNVDTTAAATATRPVALPAAQRVISCGYNPDQAARALEDLYRTLGGLPRALLLASAVTLEGAIRFLRTLPDAELAACRFGSYDWDPYATALRFPVHMVRQNVDGLMGEAFRVIDGAGIGAGEVVQVRPELVRAG